MLGDVYRWYFRRVLPRIGGMLSGDRDAYTYLPRSVSRFFRPAQLRELMEKVGYTEVSYRVWTMATVALHTGKRVGTDL
jgi:demethylmenaquinone methyltransferase/2-methoxy-6-polyprenyl-1,4-benzoquinol methylase